MAHDFDQAPADFQVALTTLGSARTRSDVTLVEAPAPTRIAPYAVAINGELTSADVEATGRFVLLHDPEGHDAWSGTFRIIALVKTHLEPEMGVDDMWSDVAWSWLTESLEAVPHRALGGTVTKVTNSSYGELADRADEVHVELRVSWTPTETDMAPHVRAWTDLLATCAGVPPLPEGVTMLPGRSA